MENENIVVQITALATPLWAKIVRFFKKQSPTNGSHKWETIWESTESVKCNVNGLCQTDIRNEFCEVDF